MGAIAPLFQRRTATTFMVNKYAYCTLTPIGSTWFVSVISRFKETDGVTSDKRHRDVTAKSLGDDVT